MTVVVPVEASQVAKNFFKTLRDNLGFHLKSASFSREAFGNICVLADGVEFQIEYQTDRGDETLQVIVDGNAYLVEDIAKLAGCPATNVRDIQEDMNLIIENTQRLRACLRTTSHEVVSRVLKESCRERLHRLFPGSTATQ